MDILERLGGEKMSGVCSAHKHHESGCPQCEALPHTGGEMMDRHKLHNELTEFHIMALYDFMSPTDYEGITTENLIERRELGIKRYRTDPMFNARVSIIVSRTMDIIQRNESPPEEEEEEG
jgi:hypothetical protein